MKKKTEEISGQYEQLSAYLGERISEEMKRRRVDQISLAQKSGQSQSTISHIVSGKTNVSMKTVFLVMEALGMNPLQEISHCCQEETPRPDALEHVYEDVSRSASKTLICDPSSSLFNGQLGNYYIYFHSTNQHEDKCLHGTLNLRADGERCAAELELFPQEPKESGEPDRKIYRGYVFLSPIQNAVYIFLFNEQIGEICFLAYPYHQILSTRVMLECTMAMVVTISAGIDSRVPTAHRMFLTRTMLDEKEEQQIRGQLRMNKSLIRISKDTFDTICRGNRLSQAFEDFFKDNAKTREYYEIEEDSLKQLARDGIEYFQDLCTLREYSDAPKNNKINKGVISRIYRKMLWRAD